MQDDRANPTTRPINPDDAPALEALMRRSFALGGPDGEREADRVAAVRRMVEVPSRVAVAVEGASVVGYVWPDGAMLEVDPPHRRRGHGRRLLEAGRAIAAADGERVLELWVPVAGPGAAFAPAVGMRRRASMYRMALPAGDPAPVPGPNPGVAVRAVTPGADDAAYARLAAACFAEHPSPMRLDEATIARAHARPDFDPTLVEVAFDPAAPDALVGFCRAVLVERPDDRLGDVALLGVLPSHRGRGIGAWLLARAVATLRTRGAREVELVVDAQNRSALGLYLAAGFAVTAEWPRWTIGAPGAAR